MVEGKRFLIIAGELSNSAASSEAWMAPHWARLRAMHVNTVLAPVSWQLVSGGSAGIDKAWEGRFENGTWVPGRLLNGDQTHQSRHIALYAGDWKIQKVRLYTYR